MTKTAKTDEFIVGCQSNGYDAFFEQDDATGYLYLSDKTGVLYDLHIYNRTPSFSVEEKDVEVIWTDSGDRCGVVILGKLRGVIGINGDMCRPAYVMSSDGIVSPNGGEALLWVKNEMLGAKGQEPSTKSHFENAASIVMIWIPRSARDVKKKHDHH